eukprot:TRINITY_DN6498_c0_g1_i1.p1 TRINITY_DN6498_c0_g1~~TRINITY_DN6498_c0_g1_i1.p1  ORF type:complete len:220 (-),score=31.06 TRINITY_DN6498_c0_g1_i1:835-1494(-)
MQGYIIQYAGRGMGRRSRASAGVIVITFLIGCGIFGLSFVYWVGEDPSVWIEGWGMRGVGIFLMSSAAISAFVWAIWTRARFNCPHKSRPRRVNVTQMIRANTRAAFDATHKAEAHRDEHARREQDAGDDVYGSAVYQMGTHADWRPVESQNVTTGRVSPAVPATGAVTGAVTGEEHGVAGEERMGVVRQQSLRGAGVHQTHDENDDDDIQVVIVADTY